MLVLSNSEFMRQYAQEKGPEHLSWQQGIQRTLAALTSLSINRKPVIQDAALPEKYVPRHLKPKQ